MMELQCQLSEQFEKLGLNRTTPVFFIEHGLSDYEIEDLKTHVRDLLTTHPIEDCFWNINPLPLLVVATEVGYLYRGNGTDFWPNLDQFLGIQLSPQNRQRLRLLFEVASKKYQGCNPPDSMWATAFHLIAWPITHALLPREFHRPLAATLAKLNENIRDIEDAALYAAVRESTRNSSMRFDTWLANQELVVEVIRKFIDGNDENGKLNHSTLNRIHNDLFLDDIARRDFICAERKQRNISSRKSKRQIVPSASKLTGELRLSYRNEQLVLEAWFPNLIEQIMVPLRRALRCRRYAPKFWGVSSRVPSEQFLSGLPFDLKITSIPVEDSPMLSGFKEFELPEEYSCFLERLTLDISLPLLFSRNTEGDSARQIRGKEITKGQFYWLLVVSDPEVSINNLPILGTLGPFTCYECDTENSASLKYLLNDGYRVNQGVKASFVGIPSLDWSSYIPRYSVGEQIYLYPKLSEYEEIVIRSEDNDFAIKAGSLLKIPIEHGERSISICTSDGRKMLRYMGCETQSNSNYEICSVDLICSELTVQSLLAGNMSLRVDAIAPLEGLEIILGIEASGQRYTTSMTLGALPVIIGSDSKLWTNLLDDYLITTILKDSCPVITAQVGVITAKSWQLELRLNSCWWEGLTLRSELGNLKYGGVSALHPLEEPSLEVSIQNNDTVLLAPLHVDPAVFGVSANYSGLCIAPNQISLCMSDLVKKPKLRRMRRADSNVSIGLEELVNAYLRWSLAECTSLTAEIRRRQVVTLLDSWICELSCGIEWAKKENSLPKANHDPWKLLIEECLESESGLGRDPYVKLSRTDDNKVIQLGVAEIRRNIPELWERIGPPCELDIEDFDSFDLASGRAYAELSEKYLKVGNLARAEEIREGDPGRPSQEWLDALLRVKAKLEMHDLAEMLYPTNSVTQLISLDYMSMSFVDITDELYQWSRHSNGAIVANPGREVVSTLLQLWLAPEKVVYGDLIGAVDALIVDRCLARATRYMCLRSKHLSGGGH